MAEKAKAISISQLSAAAHRAAQTALNQTKNLQGQKPEPGVIIDPVWIIGIIFRNAEVQFVDQYLTVANQIAPQVQEHVGGGVAAARTATPGALYVTGRHILLGYRAFTEDVPSLE